MVRLGNAADWNHAFAAWKNVNLAGCRLNMTCTLAAVDADDPELHRG
ncbi:MAG TPA: hypothetical protein VM347_06535 [Nonomuraea sp.]|nr:hypothetical protein [Nonomuraea sp.]